MTHKEAERICADAAAKLGEHFEAVQILVTWSEGHNSRMVKRGTGNWYARQGMAQAFINLDVAEDQAYQIAKKLKDDDWSSPA